MPFFQERGGHFPLRKWGGTDLLAIRKTGNKPFFMIKQLSGKKPLIWRGSKNCVYKGKRVFRQKMGSKNAKKVTFSIRFGGGQKPSFSTFPHFSSLLTAKITISHFLTIFDHFSSANYIQNDHTPKMSALITSKITISRNSATYSQNHDFLKSVKKRSFSDVIRAHF